MICCLFFADLQGKNWTDFSAWDLRDPGTGKIKELAGTCCIHHAAPWLLLAPQRWLHSITIYCIEFANSSLRCSERRSKNPENTNAHKMALSAAGIWKQIPGSCAFISAKELGYCFCLKLVAMVVSSGLSPRWKLFASVTQQHWQPNVCIYLQHSSNCATGTWHFTCAPQTASLNTLGPLAVRPEGKWEISHHGGGLSACWPQTKWKCWSETPRPGGSFPSVLFGFCSTTWDFREVSGVLKVMGSPAWHSDLLIPESLPFSNEPQSLGSQWSH